MQGAQGEVPTSFLGFLFYGLDKGWEEGEQRDQRGGWAISTIPPGPSMDAKTKTG